MTCKQRKLEYIRLKNKLRIGKSKFKTYTKFSNELIDDTDFMIGFIKQSLNDAEKMLFKKFRIILDQFYFQIGMDDNDFLRNTKTLMITLYN